MNGVVGEFGLKTPSDFFLGQNWGRQKILNQITKLYFETPQKTGLSGVLNSRVRGGIKQVSHTLKCLLLCVQ